MEESFLARAINTFEQENDQAPDPVAAGYGPLREIPCIMIPHGRRRITCAESVLRLAVQVADKQAATDSHLSLNTPDLTLPQMRRKLMRMGLGHFPIYIFVTPPAGELGEDYQPTFIPFRGTKHREDNWCIIYIPADPEHRFALARDFRRHLAGPMEPHWAFAQLEPPPELPEFEPRLHPEGLIFISRVPVPADDETTYWRCILDKSNFEEFQQRVELHPDLVCACAIDCICDHERDYKRRHPATKVVSLMSRAYRAGAMRAVCETSPALRCGPRNVAHIKTQKGNIEIEDAYDTHAVIDIGQLTSPFSLITTALFPRSWEPWNWLGRPNAPFELPRSTAIVDVGGLRMKCYDYQPRHRLFATAQAGVCLVSGIYLILSNLPTLKRKTIDLRPLVDVKTQAYKQSPTKWLYNQARNSLQTMIRELVTVVRDSIPALKPVIRLPESETIVAHVVRETWSQKIYRQLYHSIGSGLTRLAGQTPSVLKCGGLAVGAYLTYVAYRHIRIRMSNSMIVPVVSCPIQRPYGDTRDLKMVIPKEEEVISRLSLLPEVSYEHAADILRRISAEKNWRVKYTPEELALWAERVVKQPGKTRLEFDRPGKCVNCKQRARTYRQICKLCSARMRNMPPEMFIPSDALVSYIGMLPLHSQTFEPVEINVRPGVQVKHNHRILFDDSTSHDEIFTWYKHQDVRTTLRGRSTGPTFLGQRPKCFPRGDETAVMAFLIRLGNLPKHHDDDPAHADHTRQWFKRMENYFLREIGIVVTEPESRTIYLSHFTGAKLAKMLEAENDINHGNFRPIDPKNPACRMGGFTKAEKSNKEKFSDCTLKEKKQEKPRFICCPEAAFLFQIGPYTHAQTKWLAHEFTWDSRMFYAGCATPQEMNAWLNKTYKELGECVTIADDISSCDASHSEFSMEYHKRMRHHLFGGRIPIDIELLFEAETQLRIRIGSYQATVSFVNGSGVSDTSFKNSLLCLVIRVFAVAHAIKDLTTMQEDEMFAFVTSVRDAIFTSASGDDGLTRVPNFLFGTDIMSAESRARYQEMWGYFRFTVTVEIYPEYDWRKATYLACRPTWTGDQYEFTPEPARRMRNLFWQLDNSMHPIVWARSIAVSLKKCAGANPILGPLCDFYLNNTQGPTTEHATIFDNPNSVWHGYQTEGKTVTERAINEMLLDYNVTKRDYDIYLSMLKNTPSVFVNFSCHFLEQVFRNES